MTDDGLRIVVDTRRNTIVLRFGDGEPASWRETVGIVDIGTSGALLGVEFAVATDLAIEADKFDLDRDKGTGYVEVMPGDGAVVRSTSAALRIANSMSGEPIAIEVPRRGNGYEIGFPSGNQ